MPKYTTPKYKVWVSGWGKTEGHGDVFEMEAFSIEEAVVDTCILLDSLGNFVDEYPDGLEFSVKDEEGKISKYSVSTEWDPVFYASKMEK